MCGYGFPGSVQFRANAVGHNVLAEGGVCSGGEAEEPECPRRLHGLRQRRFAMEKMQDIAVAIGEEGHGIAAARLRFGEEANSLVA